MANPLKCRVKIGPFRFKFQEVNLNPGSEDNYHYGLTEMHESVCYIHTNQAAEVKRETYFHEALHAIFFTTGLSDRFTDDEEEKIIQQLSPALLDVLQCNPEYTAYILQVDE